MKDKNRIRWYEYLTSGAQSFRGLGKGGSRAGGRRLAEVPVRERDVKKDRQHAFAGI